MRPSLRFTERVLLALFQELVRKERMIESRTEPQALSLSLA
jgi:hypothetical protein